MPLSEQGACVQRAQEAVCLCVCVHQQAAVAEEVDGLGGGCCWAGTQAGTMQDPHPSVTHLCTYWLSSLPRSPYYCCWCSTTTQAYSLMHAAADGKLPRITTMLHVEAFHALCQHPELVTKVREAAVFVCGIACVHKEGLGPPGACVCRHMVVVQKGAETSGDCYLHARSHAHSFTHIHPHNARTTNTGPEQPQ